MINVGRLKHRIEIYKFGEYENTLGETTTGLQKIGEVWGEVHPLKGKEYIEGGLTNQETTFKVLIRYIKDLTEDMFLKVDGMELNINTICDIDLKHRYIELMCTKNMKKVERYVSNRIEES